MTGAEVQEIIKIILLAVWSFFVGWTVKDLHTLHKAEDCKRAKTLVSKKGYFKLKGRVLIGQVIAAVADDNERPVVWVEVGKNKDIYYIPARKFTPFEEEYE